MNSWTGEGQPGATLLREADRLASALDDYRHHLNSSPYLGNDKARSVQATVTGDLQVTDLIIEDSLLSLGAEVVVQRVTEALLNAQAAANRGRQDRAAQLFGVLGLNAEIEEQFDSAMKDIRADRRLESLRGA